jgi:signal transduction histidine kinase
MTTVMVVGISIAVILSVSMVGYLSYIQQRSAFRSFREQEDVLARFTIANIELGLIVDRIDTIEETINRLQTYSIFKGIVISDRETILTIRRPDGFAPPSHLVVEKGNAVIWDDVSYKRYDLTDRDGEVFGDVLIAFTHLPVEQEARSALIRTFGAGLLILLPLFGLLYWQVVRMARLQYEGKLIAAEAMASEAKAAAEQSKAIALGIEVYAHTQMEEVLKEKTDELAHSNAKLEQANKSLETFNYLASHDLRAPLRGIHSLTEILLSDYALELSTEAQRYLSLIQNRSITMGLLLSDLLSFSKLTHQQLIKQPVVLTDLVRATLEDLSAEQKGRQIEIKIGDLPLCHADPSLLKQVLMNLLGNALKYTDLNKLAIIEVGCRRDSPESEQVFFVRDNGMGFDSKYVQKVFDVFARLPSASQSEGTGLGLAIVQSIIERHGGRVWAESEVKAGATFFFTLGNSAG